MKACVLRGRYLTAALLASVVSLAPGRVFGQTSADYASIDAVFAQYDKEFAPGCVLGIYDGGQLAYGRGYGSANLEHQVPITLDTAFYVGSVSKQFTAFVIALLIARGELAPADSVRRYLPELPEWADRVTINDLVHHTSGIRDFLTLWEISGRTFADELSVDKAIELIARQNALDFPSGTQWSYTNSGYFLLAQIVHRVTGRSLSQFTHDAIFTPLGMAASHFHDDTGRIVQRRASGYAPDGAGVFRNATTSYAVVGSGGLFTTVHDLIKWDENFYDNKLGGGREPNRNHNNTRPPCHG